MTYNLTFRKTMDQHARDVFRFDELIGSIQWHGGTKRFVIAKDWMILTLSDLQEIAAELQKQPVK